MNMKSKPTGMFSPARGITAVGGSSPDGFASREMRPMGMLVQKRNSDADHSPVPVPVPTIRVKVKYGSSYLDFVISSQASFGDLKKLVAKPTGLHPEEQKLIFKDKERESRTFLDVAGVIDGSKLVLVEDTDARERRFLEARDNAQMQKALKDITEISLEVDKFAKQVINLETQVCGGKRVMEKSFLSLVEQLMTQLIKLDEIVGDGDVKLKRRLQVKRVQKYIETLDKLKTRNSMIGNIAPLQKQQQQQQQQQKITAAVEKMQINPVQKQQEQHRKHRLAVVKPVVATKNWETGVSAKTPYKNSGSAVNYGTNIASSRPKWEYFV
ncbi:BAG family molecular chaperone regulator 1 [Heracleum sosnowskyi]|uniref:BAG family molecular chaperone regulator 1 n=1 Tax=Heracleum sosnowskyi TaxID=360622 RepID=A0AAD8LXZ3_9APIA|nr:BAG family molecular chaperone regulator 1 [Heracleum sosnowskyi]